MSKATIGEQIVKLNMDMTYVKKEVDTINNKLDAFILSANETYANKQEVHYLEERINRLDLDNEAQWKKIIKIGERLVYIGVVVILIGKQLGISL